MVRKAALGVLLISLIGCEASPPTVSSSPNLSARFLGSVASIPGQPITAPGSELSSRASTAQAIHSAYAWVEILEDGKSKTLVTGESIFAILNLDDGEKIHVPLLDMEGSVQRIAIPAGFETKPKSARLDIFIGQGKAPIATFPITTFADPVRAIQPSETRMPHPRWKVSRDTKHSNLQVDVLGVSKDNVSIIKLLRTSYVDFSKTNVQPVTQAVSGSSLRSLHHDPFHSKDIELEETEITFDSHSVTLQLEDVSIVETHKSPVLAIKKAATLQLPDGSSITIPIQNLAPFRAGRNRQYGAQLQINVKQKAGNLNLPPAVAPFPIALEVKEITPNLGNHGIENVQLVVQEASITQPRLRLNRKGDYKPEKLPPLKIHLQVKIPRIAKVYKGIVPVQSSEGL